MNSKMKGIGMIFPIMQMGIAFRIGTPRDQATRRPPLSSRMGIMEMMKITTSLDTYCPRVEANHNAIESIL